ncbi:ankyrin repeat-containing domain protein [Apiosordaria backusii]|uniref:Ankyrin repeat-containing domain protein n=1 Tax=Apiosordaria backusii TaxID=314023 RepID=A0AA40BKZ7_9PEZI|nr:ankyrin repeat-containing domain protein [Apiosordaria backusii]
MAFRCCTLQRERAKEEWYLGCLLDNGAKVNDRVESDGTTALGIASAKGYVRLTKLLTGRKADIGAKDGRGRTALHIAASSGKVDIPRVLLERLDAAALRQIIEQPDRQGCSALLLAAEMGMTEAVQVLLEPRFGADVTAEDTSTMQVTSQEQAATKLKRKAQGKQIWGCPSWSSTVQMTSAYSKT